MKFIDLTGRKFGRLTVIERAENTVTPKGIQAVRQKCKCDCGNEVIVFAGNLRKGNTSSCGCYNIDSLRKNKPIDITGQRFGKLVAIRRVDDYISPSGNHSSKWECKCDCGTIKEFHLNSLRRGLTNSCGCIGSSTGEAKIESILRRNNVNYRREYSFDGLVSSKGCKLRFDFSLFDSYGNILGLIEFQGPQHFDEFKFNDKSFGELQRTETDKTKKEYCEKHKIPLFEIHYDEDVESAAIKIISMLYDNLVPSSISNREGVTTIPNGST